MQLRWGICGCGLIAGDFVRALRLLPKLEHVEFLPKSVVLRWLPLLRDAQNEPKSVQNQFSDRNGSFLSLGSFERTFTTFMTGHQLENAQVADSYSHLCRMDCVDIVYVALQNNHHRSVVIEALNKGKHVLCEKPMGVNAAEVGEMIGVAKKNKRFLMEAIWSRFVPAYIRLKEEIENNSIGQPTLLIADLGFDKLGENKMIAESGGGCLYNTGMYLPSLALYVFGCRKPKEVIATGLKENGVDQWAVVTLKFDDNKVAVLHYSAKTATMCRAQICGPLGVLEIPSLNWCPTSVVKTLKDERSGKMMKSTMFDFPLLEPDEKYTFPHSSELAREAAAVRQQIMAGAIEHPSNSHEESVVLHEMLEEIRLQLGVRFPTDLGSTCE